MTSGEQGRTKVRVVANARARKSPGFLGKSDDDVLSVHQIGEVFKVYGEPVEMDGLQWRNVEIRGLAAWIAVSSAGEQMLMDVPDGETDFDRSFWFVMRHEGGSQITDDPRDPGGLTKYGVSQRSHPGLDIRALTLEQAKAIYKSEYWEGSGAGKLSWPMNLAVFDFAVNAGCAVANATIVVSGANFSQYQDLRRKYYRSLELFKVYGAGWMNRVDDLGRYVASVQAYQ